MRKVREHRAALLRKGAATLDYVLVLGVAFSLGGTCVYLSGKIIKLVHEMIHVMVGWPFL